MTFYLFNRYPERVNDASDEYPRGSFKDRTDSTTDDGTYCEQDWANDMRGFPERILTVAGVTPDGSIDNAQSSQVYTALMQIISGMITTATQPQYAIATGSVNVITATFPNEVTLTQGVSVFCRASGMNTSTAPTFAPNGLDAKAIVKGSGNALVVGDIKGAGYVMHLIFDSRFDRWVLLNPAFGVSQTQDVPVGTLAFMATNTAPSGWLLVDGSDHPRSQYAALVSACPNFITAGSNANLFRFVDLRGYFLRVQDQGHGIDPDSARSLGSIQSDAQRNITGSFGSEALFVGGASGTAGPDGAFYASIVGSSHISSKVGSGGNRITFDASRQVPTSSEFRPKNAAMPLYIKY